MSAEGIEELLKWLWFITIILLRQFFEKLEEGRIEVRRTVNINTAPIELAFGLSVDECSIALVQFFSETR